MITIYTGSPGSCKTVHAIFLITSALNHGRQVFTNIEGLSFLGGPLSQILGLHKNLHFLDQEQASKFWLHIQPGSLVIIDEFLTCMNFEQLSGDRSAFFDFWFHYHLYSRTDLVLISQIESRMARFFHHAAADSPIEKSVNPDQLFYFSDFSTFGIKFYTIRCYAIDTSHFFDGLESVKPDFRLRWKCDSRHLLSQTLKRIRTFFGKEASK